MYVPTNRFPLKVRFASLYTSLIGEEVSSSLWACSDQDLFCWYRWPHPPQPLDVHGHVVVWILTFSILPYTVFRMQGSFDCEHSFWLDRKQRQSKEWACACNSRACTGRQCHLQMIKYTVKIPNLIMVVALHIVDTNWQIALIWKNSSSADRNSVLHTHFS